jgi:hypothetical protein
MIKEDVSAERKVLELGHVLRARELDLLRKLPHPLKLSLTNTLWACKERGPLRGRKKKQATLSC